METVTGTPLSPPEINGPEPDSTFDAIDGGSDSSTAREQVSDQHDLISELETLRRSHESLRLETSTLEESLRLLQQEKDEMEKVNGNLTVMIGELLRERDSLRDEIGRSEASFKGKEEELERKLDEELREKEEIRNELEVSRKRIEVFESEKKETDEFLLKISDSIKSVKEHLVSVIELLDDEKVIERENKSETQESRALWEETTTLKTLASEAESRVCGFKESRNKEKKELENSVVSLTEENRDINSLLRIALVEKEAVEKSLNRLKGNSEQKRVALLQIAERGLQRVGFGFMMGGGSNEQAPESLGANPPPPPPPPPPPASNKSDSSECEEEVVSLVCFSCSTQLSVTSNLLDWYTLIR